ncbi:MAG: DUF882 domain-containing protein [Arenicellales bacterium]|jgi:uncharacterized protein YcbK (DUF882 family)
MRYTLLARSQPGRRRFLGQTLAVAAGLCVAGEAPAVVLNRDSDRTLAFHNLHTNENLKCRYWSRGDYDPVALEDIAFVLRDFRADETKAMDPALLDLLAVVRRKLNTKEPYHVISGYRSPKTNAMLRAKSKGVAKHSLHMEGKAIDVRIPGIQLAELRRTGLDLKAGGVGYYPKSRFVHLDTGRPRFW